MCGIVAYAGNKDVAPILVGGLKTLEYRGYDSAGVGIQNGDGTITITKVPGRVEELADVLSHEHSSSNARSNGDGPAINGGQEPALKTVGIAHSRWATHGGVTQANAHPHASSDGRVAIVHNGIVENYQELRAELIQQGFAFRSQTDSEVIAHLLSGYLADGADLMEAMCRAAERICGASAIVATSADEPGRIVGVRLGNAGGLVVGFAEQANLLASDVLAVLPYTSKVAFLEHGEAVSVTAESVEFCSLDGRRVEKQAFETGRSYEAAQKGEYAHFMAKEIAEQPEAVASAMRKRVDFANGKIDLPEVPFTVSQLRSITRVVVCGMGTSMHAGMYGAHMIEALARVPAYCENAAELRYKEPVFDENTLLISVTQSGETVDTLAAMEEAARHGAKQLTLVENEGTQATRMANGTLLLGAGHEVAVASTKTMTASLTILYQLAVYLASARGVLTRQREEELVHELSRLPSLLGEMLSTAEACRELGESFLKDFSHLLYLGRGPCHPIAMEGALKMKEVAYIHAEGYSAGEMKHGVNALISADMPTIAMAPRGRLYGKMVSNLNEVKARNGHLTVIGTEGDEFLPTLADRVIFMPEASEWIEPILSLIPMQLLAYHTSVALGLDPDKPRNLAKTVTVE
ncbi:MAG: glutamine--fructose-6-phosphate transaminase (isomerizing) [Chloroflexota bacterium]